MMRPSKVSHLKTSSLTSTKFNSSRSTKAPMETIETRLHTVQTSPPEIIIKKPITPRQAITLESETSSLSSNPEDFVTMGPKIKIELISPTLKNYEESIPNDQRLPVDKMTKLSGFSTYSNNTPPNPNNSSFIKNAQPKTDITPRNPIENSETSILSINDEKKENIILHKDKTPVNSKQNNFMRRFSNSQSTFNEKRARASSNYPTIDRNKDNLSSTVHLIKNSPNKSNEKNSRINFEKSMKSTNSLFNFGGHKKKNEKAKNIVGQKDENIVENPDSSIERFEKKKFGVTILE